MPKFRVQLAQLIRETATVVVEAPSLVDLKSRLSEVYDMEAGESDWEIDCNWGTDEGTHQVLGPAPDDAVVDFTLNNEEGGEEVVDAKFE